MLQLPERKRLRLFVASLAVSDYTGRIDRPNLMKGAKRLHQQMREMCSNFTGLAFTDGECGRTGGPEARGAINARVSCVVCCVCVCVCVCVCMLAKFTRCCSTLGRDTVGDGVVPQLLLTFLCLRTFRVASCSLPRCRFLAPHTPVHSHSILTYTTALQTRSWLRTYCRRGGSRMSSSSFARGMRSRGGTRS
jgi:hypothetical protein